MKWKRSIITLALAAAAFMAPAAVLAEEAKAPAVAATQAAVTSAQAAPAAVAPAEAAPAAAEAPKVAEPVLNTGNTAWMLVCAALVLLMLPGLALFYGGMVRSKNVLSTLMHSFVAMGIVGVQWAVIGYSLAFGPDMGGMGLVGDFSRALLNGMISFKDGAPVYTLWQTDGTAGSPAPETGPAPAGTRARTFPRKVPPGMNVSYWAIWTRENASAKRKQVACSGLTWR